MSFLFKERTFCTNSQSNEVEVIKQQNWFLCVYVCVGRRILKKIKNRNHALDCEPLSNSILKSVILTRIKSQCKSAKQLLLSKNQILHLSKSLIQKQDFDKLKEVYNYKVMSWYIGTKIFNRIGKLSMMILK